MNDSKKISTHSNNVPAEPTDTYQPTRDQVLGIADMLNEGIEHRFRFAYLIDPYSTRGTMLGSMTWDQLQSAMLFERACLDHMLEGMGFDAARCRMQREYVAGLYYVAIQLFFLMADTPSRTVAEALELAAAAEAAR